MRFEWNSRSLHDLVKLRNQGYTFEEIAEELSLSYGKDVSRNAVSKRYRKLKEQQDELNEEVEVEDMRIVDAPAHTEPIRTYEGALAVITGYLVMQDGKVIIGRVSKILKELGYIDKNLKKDELMDFQQELKADKDLLDLYNQALERKIKLDDLYSVTGRQEQVKEKQLQELITPAIVDKERDNARLREMRHMQRSGAHKEILMEDTRKDIKSELPGLDRPKYLQREATVTKSGERSLVLSLSDWHVGLIVHNHYTGGYNFTRLCKYLDNLLTYTENMIDTLGIEDVHVHFLGDLVEHNYMRKGNQAFETEFRFSEQKAKGLRLLVDVIQRLSNKVHVNFVAISGNHDREEGNRGDNIHNDTVIYEVLDNLLLFKEQGFFPNATIFDNRMDTYSAELEVAGFNILLKHGDYEKRTEKAKIPKHVKTKPIDLYYTGHVHTASFNQENFANFFVVVGSPVGENDYSKSLAFPTTYGSQHITVLEKGNPTPWMIPVILSDK